MAVLAATVGLVFGFYEKLWWFDEAVHTHFVFSLTLTLALYAYGVVLTGARDHGLLLVLAIACIGIALGVLWEVAEWVYDEVVQPNIIYGKTDTIIDLFMDLIGGIAAGFVTLRVLQK